MRPAVRAGLSVAFLWEHGSEPGLSTQHPALPGPGALLCPFCLFWGQAEWPSAEFFPQTDIFSWKDLHFTDAGYFVKAIIFD